jgi:hypothetical protein
MSIIVSLTSTASRLEILRYTLISLTEQTHKPNSIIVNLSKEAYLMDKGVSELPAWFSLFEDKGVQVNWVENTGSYRKLLPRLSEASDDDVIVTCDDDVIYAPHWLASLIKTADEFPNHIVCGRARKPSVNFLKKQQSYLHWSVVKPGSEGAQLVPIGIAGVVYRPALLDIDFILKKDFLEEAPKQDDLWFKVASRRKGTLVKVSNEAESAVFPIETKNSLSSSNAGGQYVSKWNNVLSSLAERVLVRIKAYLGFAVNGNDKVWRHLTEKYFR